MDYHRMPIEIESPEQMGYDNIQFNLTESSIRDVKFGDLDVNLKELIVAYGDHIGHPKLRQLIAEEAGVDPDEVLITTGAAMALFIISTTLLGKGDHLLVEHPNYATNIETPRAIGAKIDFLKLNFEDKFQLSVQEIEKKLFPTTKLLSITVPHNPTGTVMPQEDLEAIIALAAKHNVKLLVDETYRDLNFTDHKSPMAASLGNHVISVSSLSKAYGLPGIRVGWLICKDKALMKKFLAAKEQMVICGSIVDEEIAYRFMLTKTKKLPEILQKMKHRLEIVKTWMKESSEYLEWIEPQGGVICFPRITAKIDVEEFYRVLNEQFKTFVGPGHWFEMDKSHMRIGYGWPKDHEELRKGLENITAAIKICLEKQH